MSNPVGPLLPSDELFCHQTAETFATVSSTDLAWTEKVCAMAAKRDGSLQLGFGLGKYTNRNVMDGYAAMSRGPEQITVRASRALFPAMDAMVIGPIEYEVLEPLQRVRFALAPNDSQPLAFEWVFKAVLPCQTEDRSHSRTPDGRRVTTDLVRYHQIGEVESGWVEIDGIREVIEPGEWVSTRDHSWGTRYDVGQPLTDVEPGFPIESISFSMIWSPLLFERPDGSQYGVFLHLQKFEGWGSVFRKVVMGGIEHPDGRVEPIVDLELDLAVNPVNRRITGGTIHARMADGSERPFHVTVPGDTGVHLGAGLYFGYRGHHHGDWRGPLHVEGERIADCREPEVARELHQIRDTVVIVDDPLGGGRGVGNCQPIFSGPHPTLGLPADDSFI